MAAMVFWMFGAALLAVGRAEVAAPASAPAVGAEDALRHGDNGVPDSNKTDVDGAAMPGHWRRVGHGGCSTPDARYAPPIETITAISALSCARRAAQPGVYAFEYCKASNCGGTCKLFGRLVISGTNGYPTVDCYQWVKYPLRLYGPGGCSTRDAQYPVPNTTYAGVERLQECHDYCYESKYCGAYQYCEGSNCHGACELFGAEQIRGTNGFPGVSCYVRHVAR